MRSSTFLCLIALCATVFKPVGAVAETPADPFSANIDTAARAASLPTEILTRLLWVESQFHPLAVSPAGAQGVAQFMPATAAERGLTDPFVPEQAIPQAAHLLSDLTKRFGNIGLGLTAYNAGPGRIARWLDDSAYLPDETQRFVTAITGKSAQEWAVAARFDPKKIGPIGCGTYAALGSLQTKVARTDHAQTLPILAQSGRLLPAWTGSGQPLPILQRSGEPLPVLLRSGEGSEGKSDFGGGPLASKKAQDWRCPAVRRERKSMEGG